MPNLEVYRQILTQVDLETELMFKLVICMMGSNCHELA